MTIKNRVSIIIPSNKERFLKQTIEDILSKATGDFEILVSLDGYWPEPHEIITHDKVNYIHHGKNVGMRGGINSGRAVATGEYLLKCDAHVMFDKGFDEKLKADMEDYWIVIPRRKRLDAEKWDIQDVGKPDVDYEFLSYPYWKEQEVGMHGTIWTERIVGRKDKPEYDIDENMSFQGSCWFMKKTYFDFLELMDDQSYGQFANEAQELGLKAWLSGGKVMTNKKTWYAHLHKGKKYGRGYFISKGTFDIAREYTLNWVKDEAWHKQTMPFTWLIEHFWPVPTWPEDRSLWMLKKPESM